MQNLARLAYLSVQDKALESSAQLYVENLKLLKSFHTRYSLPVQNRALLMMFYSARNVLKHPYLSESIQLSNKDEFIDVLKSQCNLLFSAVVYIHNEYLKCKGDYKEFEGKLIYTQQEVSRYCENIRSACNSLVDTSDFLKVNFLSLILVVEDILFFSKYTKDCIDYNIAYVRQLIMAGELPIATVGVNGCCYLAQDAQDYTSDVPSPSCDIEYSIQKLKSRVRSSGIVKLYRQFFLQDLEEKYGCKFNDLKNFLVQVSREHPNGAAFIPEMHVILTNRRLKAINVLTRTEYVYVYNCAARKKVCSVRSENVPNDDALPGTSSGITSKVSCNTSETRYKSLLEYEESFSADKGSEHDLSTTGCTDVGKLSSTFVQKCKGVLNFTSSRDTVIKKQPNTSHEKRKETLDENELCLSGMELDRDLPSTSGMAARVSSHVFKGI